jgi:hypothetical protein
MTCAELDRMAPDSLLASELEPVEYRRAADHLRECPECRRRAVVADPAVLFVDLPSLEVTDAEVEAVRSAVGAMRRARALEEESSRPHGRWWRHAAAAALLAALLLVPGNTPVYQEAVNGSPGLTGGVGELESLIDKGGFLASATEPSSIIENLNRPQARIYQLTEEDLSVVMIVDESLDL